MTWANIFKQFADLISGPGVAPALDLPAPNSLPDVIEADNSAAVDMSIWPAPNFSPAELTCRCCGRVKVETAALIMLQAVRESMGRALRINSAYRCPIHNANVGGAPLSQHKEGKAFDISVSGWTEDERAELVAAAYHAGFTGFGGYTSFLHVDVGRRRQWGQPWGHPL